VCITFVHHFHPDTSAVEHICPGADNATLRIKDRLVEVKTIEVEGHGAHAHCGEPDSDDRPCTQEEVQGTAVVERSILEDQAIEDGRPLNDAGFFFLQKSAPP